MALRELCYLLAQVSADIRAQQCDRIFEGTRRLCEVRVKGEGEGRW